MPASMWSTSPATCAASRPSLDVDVHCFGADRAGRHRPPARPDAGRGRGQRGPADDVDRPVDRRRPSGGADLVHSHTWYANFAGFTASMLLRRPARRDHALARAAAPLEGRAAGRRLRAVLVLRAVRHRERRRGHRRVGRHGAGHPALLPGGRPGPGLGHPQRHRHRGVRADVLGHGPARSTASTRRDRPCSSSAASPGRRACPTCWRPPTPSTRPPSSCCSPGRPTPPRSRPRSRRPITELQATRDGVIWVPEMVTKTEAIEFLSAGQRLRVPVDLRADGHRQPRGDGLRDAGRGHRDRGHPRGRRGRLDRACSSRSTPTRTTRTAPRVDPAAFAAAIAEAVNALLADPARACGDGQGRPGAGAGALQLGSHRRAHPPALRQPPL